MMLKTVIISISMLIAISYSAPVTENTPTLPPQLRETKEEADLESLTSSLNNNKGGSEKPEVEKTVEKVEDLPNLEGALTDKQDSLADYLVDTALYNEVQNIKDKFRLTGLLDEDTMRMYEGELEKRILLHMLQEMNTEPIEKREMPFYMYDDEEEEAARFSSMADVSDYMKELAESIAESQDEVVKANEKNDEDLNEDYLKLLETESKPGTVKNVQVVKVNGNEQKDEQKAKKDEVMGSSNKETV